MENGIDHQLQDDGSETIVKIRLYYDFASTLCYVTHRVLCDVAPEIEALGIELQWKPIDLTESVPWDRGDSFTEEVREAVRNTASSIGIEVEMPDPWLDSRPAAQIALGTESLANEARWRTAVFEAIFERGQPGLTPQLLELGEELVGTERAAELVAGFGLVEESTLEAEALGVTGVPTMLLDNWLFGGVYDGDAMVSILGQLAKQYREIGNSAVN